VLGLFLDGDDLAALVELHDAEALGVVDVVAEDAGLAALRILRGLLQARAKAAAVEDVVAEHHRAAVIADELLAQQERLRQTVRRGLHLIAQVQAVLAAVAEQALEVWQIHRGGDDENVPDARHHQGGQGIVDHGLVVNRQKLLRRHHCQGIQPRAGAAGQNNTFHLDSSSFVSSRR